LTEKNTLSISVFNHLDKIEGEKKIQNLFKKNTKNSEKSFFSSKDFSKTRRKIFRKFLSLFPLKIDLSVT